ncbi:MAG: hypothetical protein A2Y97_03255 [Nitrospirae bacterium RBG_13_39_12]|nr:MAG: hypothetical protein A2Y97_03255 [Nitrospirae bacterium RBG_13_39_12]
MNLNKTETTNWVETSQNKHKEIFSEIDVLLRSLDRVFYVENLPIPKDDLTNRNFYDELTAVRDVIFRILGLLEVVIPGSKKNAYWFHKFAESKFLTDHVRDLFKKELYKQDTPEKGLYLLYDLFINLKGIVTDILKTGKISYHGYLNIGQLISKEIRENSFLNPFRKDVNPELDKVENREITDIVKSIKNKDIKKHISVLYLYLFRFLRYLSHIDINSQYSVSLNSSLLILILLKSEINMFHNYTKKVTGKIKDEKLKILLNSISYQFSMETKRVYLQELKEIMRKKAPQHFRGRIENSQGILKNLTEQSIVQIAQFFKPDVLGENIFESFTTKLWQSMKLKEDLFIFNLFLEKLEKSHASEKDISHIFESLKNYMLYFESFTFKLLRYDDYDEFSSFFKDVFSFKGNEFNKILEKIKNFKIYLETTLRHISNRAELIDKPIDVNMANELLNQYL